MKIFTCTPVNFEADAHFFGRDSGLFCMALRGLGHDCQVVMPGETRSGESSFVIRAAVSNLRSSAWWASKSPHAVLFYGWGDPRYQEIASAIRNSGAVLVQNLDSAGIESPYSNLGRWLRCLAGLLGGASSFATKARLLGRAARDLVPGIYEKRRLRMMDESDFLATVSPPAGETIKAYARSLGFPQLVEKVRLLPHPCSEQMTCLGGDRQNLVLCVGRWEKSDWHQKDPRLTLHIIHQFLADNPTWKVRLIGKGAKLLCSRLGTDHHERLEFTDSVPREELVTHFQAGKILLCASRFESFHISSAEALCCGCSIVVADHPLLSSTGWFTTSQSGTLATKRNIAAMVEALAREVDQWESGQRDPSQISQQWTPRLHAKAVAGNLIEWVGGGVTNQMARPS